MSMQDRIIKILYTQPHEILPGKAPRWTENAIRRAIELAEGEK